MYFLINQSSDHLYNPIFAHVVFCCDGPWVESWGRIFFRKEGGAYTRELNSESKTKKRASYKVNILPTGSAHTLSPKSSEGEKIKRGQKADYILSCYLGPLNSWL
jgi:hypothetical protein